MGPFSHSVNMLPYYLRRESNDCMVAPYHFIVKIFRLTSNALFLGKELFEVTSTIKKHGFVFLCTQLRMLNNSIDKKLSFPNTEIKRNEHNILHHGIDLQGFYH